MPSFNAGKLVFIYFPCWLNGNGAMNAYTLAAFFTLVLFFFALLVVCILSTPWPALFTCWFLFLCILPCFFHCIFSVWGCPLLLACLFSFGFDAWCISLFALAFFVNAFFLFLNAAFIILSMPLQSCPTCCSCFPFTPVFYQIHCSSILIKTLSQILANPQSGSG